MNKILIVVNMQNDFIDGSLGTKEAQSIVDNVVEYVKNFNGDIIFLIHTEDYLNTQKFKKLSVKSCMQLTDGWNITNNLIPYANWTVKESAFGSTKLVEIINAEEYDNIEICGLCTDNYVISNALLLKANFPKANIYVHRNLCAGVTPENHEAALTTMKMCQIDIIGEPKEKEKLYKEKLIIAKANAFDKINSFYKDVSIFDDGSDSRIFANRTCDVLCEIEDMETKMKGEL